MRILQAKLGFVFAYTWLALLVIILGNSPTPTTILVVALAYLATGSVLHKTAYHDRFTGPVKLAESMVFWPGKVLFATWESFTPRYRYRTLLQIMRERDSLPL